MDAAGVAGASGRADRAWRPPPRTPGRAAGPSDPRHRGARPGRAPARRSGRPGRGRVTRRPSTPCRRRAASPMLGDRRAAPCASGFAAVWRSTGPSAHVGSRASTSRRKSAAAIAASTPSVTSFGVPTGNECRRRPHAARRRSAGRARRACADAAAVSGRSVTNSGARECPEPAGRSRRPSRDPGAGAAGDRRPGARAPRSSSCSTATSWRSTSRPMIPGPTGSRWMSSTRDRGWRGAPPELVGWSFQTVKSRTSALWSVTVWIQSIQGRRAGGIQRPGTDDHDHRRSVRPRVEDRHARVQQADRVVDAHGHGRRRRPSRSHGPWPPRSPRGGPGSAPAERPGGLTSESWRPRIEAPGFSARCRTPSPARRSTRRSEPNQPVMRCLTDRPGDWSRRPAAEAG